LLYGVGLGAKMSKGKESDPHSVMAEAFAFRLRKLYPDCEIRLGEKIKPVDLKPDVYIEHPDGRKWAYEVIYKNSHAQHILGNHRRYKEAGIQDFWISWDASKPLTQSAPANQGILRSGLVVKRKAKLTTLRKALASIHAEYTENNKSFLYYFTFDELGQVNKESHPIMRLISTGITVQEIENFVPTEKNFEYQNNYIPIIDLNFGSDGSLIYQDATGVDENLATDFISKLGLENQAEHFPIQFFESLSQMLYKMPEDAGKTVAEIYGQKLFEDVSPDELVELQEFMCGNWQEKLNSSLPAFPVTSPTASMHNAEGIAAIAKFFTETEHSIQKMDIPVLLKRFLVMAFQTSQWTSIADTMEWAEKSNSFQHLQKEKSL
jgi:hypothetical protein